MPARSIPFANAGLPMIFIELPFLALALIPVAFMEALVYDAGLRLPFRRALGGAVIANLFSTFLGVPVAWIVLVLCDVTISGGRAWGLDTPLLRLAAVTVQAPWLVPYENEAHWMVPAASLFLMLPFFVASALTESFVLRRWWREANAGTVTRLAWLSNLLSYSLLAAFWVWLLVYPI